MSSGTQVLFFPRHAFIHIFIIAFIIAFLIIEYAPNMQYVDVFSVLVCGFFLTLKFSCLFTAIAVLQLDCLSSLLSWFRAVTII